MQKLKPNRDDLALIAWKRILTRRAADAEQRRRGRLRLEFEWRRYTDGVPHQIKARVAEWAYRRAIGVMHSPYHMRGNPLYFKLITLYARLSNQPGQAHTHSATWRQWLRWGAHVFQVAGSREMRYAP